MVDIRTSCSCGAYPSEIDYKKKTICKYPRFPRRYIQFRDLVFDGQETVDSTSYDVSFKYETTNYLNKHGSYTTNLDKDLVESTTLPLDLAIPFKRLKKYTIALAYKDFIKVNLTQSGKLWAVDTGGELIWAWAKPIQFTEDYRQNALGHLQLHMQFFLPEGIWHKANASKVFLTEYDYCQFYKSLDFDGRFPDCPNNCNMDNCCNSVCAGCLERCGILEQQELYLCNNREVLLDFYNECTAKYKVNENCSLWADMYEKDYYFGMRATVDNDCGLIFDEFYSDTILESNNVEIHIVGQMTDPKVSINGVGMTIKGGFVGDLYFANGLWHFSKMGVDTPDCFAVIDQSLVEYECNQITYKVHNGTNTLQVSGISNVTVAYVAVDSWTF